MTGQTLRPQLHTLYRFWVDSAVSGTEVDQEWDGWWNGQHWHALYDLGVWDPQFVVRFERLADPAVQALADYLDGDSAKGRRWGRHQVAAMIRAALAGQEVRRG